MCLQRQPWQCLEGDRAFGNDRQTVALVFALEQMYLLFAKMHEHEFGYAQTEVLGFEFAQMGRTVIWRNDFEDQIRRPVHRFLLHDFDTLLPHEQQIRHPSPEGFRLHHDARTQHLTQTVFLYIGSDNLVEPS